MAGACRPTCRTRAALTSGASSALPGGDTSWRSGVSGTRSACYWRGVPAGSKAGDRSGGRHTRPTWRVCHSTLDRSASRFSPSVSSSEPSYAWHIRGRVLASAGGSVSVGVLVLVLLATTVGTAPFLGWRIVEDVRYTSQIDPWLSPRYGVSVFKVHPEIFDNAASRIPPGTPTTWHRDPDLDRRRQGCLPRNGLSGISCLEPPWPTPPRPGHD